MPRKKIKGREKRDEDVISLEQIEFMLTGANFVWEESTKQNSEIIPFSSWEEYKRLWNLYKDEILSHCGEFPAYFEAFKRPYAWWQFDCPDEKRIQISGPKPLSNDLGYDKTPCYWASYEDSEKAEFETVRHFLTRLNLLLPGEQEMITEAEGEENG